MRSPDPIRPAARTLAAVALASLILSALIGAVAWSPALASSRPSVEYQVKASFLFNFFRFVEWPPHPALPADRYVLCVVGPDRLGSALDEIDGKSIDGRPVEIRRLARVEEIEPCHVLFVTFPDPASEQAALERLRGLPVLTVGEGRDFLELGGLVRFYVAHGRVRFEIDGPTADHGGLRIDANLMQIGRR